jgi:hypothetical protein
MQRLAAGAAGRSAPIMRRLAAIAAWNTGCTAPSTPAIVPGRGDGRMHILITGGAGCSDSHLADQVLERGHDVRRPELEPRGLTA